MQSGAGLHRRPADGRTVSTTFPQEPSRCQLPHVQDTREVERSFHVIGYAHQFDLARRRHVVAITLLQGTVGLVGSIDDLTIGVRAIAN